MKKFILPGGALFGIVVVIVIVVALEAFAGFLLDDLTKVASNVTCEVKEVDASKPQLKLNCDGQEVTTGNASVIVTYVQNPGPVTCTLYKSGSVVCEPRKKA